MSATPAASAATLTRLRAMTGEAMSQELRKLSKFAQANGLTYPTAHRYWKRGLLEGRQLVNGTILVSGWKEEEGTSKPANEDLAIIYSRVPSAKQRERLKAQTANLTNYAHDKGYEIIDTVEEIAPAYSDRRTKLLSILYRTDWNVIIVENPGSIARFGLPFIDALLQQTGRTIVYANADDETIPEEEHYADAEAELNTLILTTQNTLGKLLGHANEKATINKAVRTLVG